MSRWAARVLVVPLPMLLGCSLDYLDEHLGYGTSGGSGLCRCGDAGGDVLYDENFDAASGYCRSGTQTASDGNGILDPDAPAGATNGCQALRAGCKDPTVGCHAYAWYRFPKTTGAVYLRIRIRMDPWAKGSSGSFKVLEVGSDSAPNQNFDIVINVQPSGASSKIKPCGWDNCDVGTLIDASDAEWHQIVLFHPNDGQSSIQYRWDETMITSLAPSTKGPDYPFEYIRFGWLPGYADDGTTASLDDIRLCGANGAAACDWHD